MYCRFIRITLYYIYHPGDSISGPPPADRRVGPLNPLKPQQSLLATKYCTSRIDKPMGKHDRQNEYLEALQTLLNFKIYYGHYLEETISCHSCGHTHITHHEKMTDVNIAVEILVDAFQNQFDTALLFSADSDLATPIRAIKQLYPEKRIIVVFPPARQSKELARLADGALHIGPNQLYQSLFPDEVTKSETMTLCRPSSWR
jgi:uncharacterized LabA/DUF88 family protein